MKTVLKYSLALLAGLSVALSCSKIGAVDANDGENAAPAGKQIIIHATLADAPTRVEYTLDDSGEKPKLTLKWESSDALLVSNASGSVEIGNPTIDATGKTATFSGTLPEGGEPYTVVVKHAGANLGATQTQAADGDLKHLEYAAMAENVTEADFDNLALTQTTGVLGLIAKLPTVVSAAVKAVIFQTESNLFNGSNTLTVNLEPGGAGDDNILYVYANVASSSIPAGTEMFIRFKVGDGENDYYTRYQVFASAVSLATGALNGLKLNCSHIDRYAGKDDKGTAAAPYLIADKYQMQAMDGLMAPGETTSFKLLDDLDMSGVTWTMLNNPSPYNKLIDFDGNGKTVSKLGGAMFYVFKGSVKNLTLDQVTTGSSGQRGVFAQYIQGTGNDITNVDISNSSITGGSNSGGLIGRINSGTAGVVSATITDCDVTNTSVKGNCAGGLLGSVEAKVVVSNCSYSGNTVTGATAKIGGLVGVTSDNTGCTFTGCRVEDATVNGSSITGDARVGGFIGQLGEGCYVYGCTVGTVSQKVEVKTGQYDATNTKSVNSGGFVGVNYGTITKDSENNHSKAYVKVTSTNTTGNPLNLGGFAGFQRGSISYSDAVVSMGDLQGQYIGGFCGYIVFMSEKTVLTDHCTVIGDGDPDTEDIRGNNYTGGFVGVAESGDFTISNCQVLEGTVVIGQSTAGGFAGQIKSGTVEDCSANVTFKSRGGNNGGFAGAITGGTVQRCSSAGTLSQISSSNNVFGGFVGYVNGVDLKKCSSTVDISVARNYVGGLVGEFQTANTVSECFYDGTISGPANTKGGLIGTVAAVAATITNCYTSGQLVGSSGTQIYGGIVGELKSGASVTNCYSTMDMSHGGRAMGGIVGRACNAGWNVSTETDNTVSKCIAWNPAITYDGTPSTSASSGAIIGYTSFKNTLDHCYRRPDMAYLNSNTAIGTTCQTSMVDQVDSDGTNWAVNGTRPAGTTPAGTSADAQYQAPYYGVAAASGTTVSSIAQSLGWTSEIWDFSGNLPMLK